MSVLIFVETAEGAAKKSSLEAVAYGAEVAKMTGTEATVLVLGELSEDELKKIGNFGAKKVLHAADPRLNEPGIQPYAHALAQAIEKENTSVLVLAKSSLGDAVAARLAARLKAGLAANVIALPDLKNGFVVKRSIYTGKAFAQTEVKGDKKILTLKKNAFTPAPTQDLATIENFSPAFNEADFTVKSTQYGKADR